MYKFQVFLVVMLCLSFCVWAEEIPEHPLIRPFPGSVLAENMSKHYDFDAYDFRVQNPDTGKNEKKTVKGEYWRLLYEVRRADGSRNTDISKLEFIENFRAAAEEMGGEILYEDRSFLTFSVPRDDGGITYCEYTGNASLGQQYLTIVDEKPFKKSLVFGPAQMKSALDKDGRVLLYEILFDYDKASLQKESLKQLEHVITLLQENPDLTLEVQGHTDDQGSDDYNLDLSQQRAETVRAFLLLFGVPDQSLFAKGYGESAPVAPNDSEENRAKNRRVELVKVDAVATDASSAESSREALGEVILGEWSIEPNARADGGSISFGDDGKYVMEERFKDGTGGGTKGDYRLDCVSSPVRIALYLGPVDNAGAALTTRYAIVRALADGRVEIQFSDDGEYPEAFVDDPDGALSMLLVRK